MNINEAVKAMQKRYKVEAGKGDEHDVSIIHKIDSNWAIVGWESGVTTPFPIAELSRVEG